MPKKKTKNRITQLELLDTPLRGSLHKIAKGGELQLHYEAENGQLFCGDSFKWLASLEAGSVDLIVADPPYNLKKAEWDSFESHDEYVEWSRQWIELASRALKPQGTLYVCGFLEILADVKVAAIRYFAGCRWLVWHYKNKANLGMTGDAHTKAFFTFESPKISR